MAERFEVRWDGVPQATPEQIGGALTVNTAGWHDAADWGAWLDDVFATEAVA